MTPMDIEGFFDAGIAAVYSHAVYNFPADSTFVEVGSYRGKSGAYMAEQIKISGKPIQFYCVDVWKNYRTYLDFQKNLMSCGLNSYVKPIRALSSLAALQFPDESLKFVFIDGDHRYSAVHTDIISWLPKVKPGGILAGHDYGAVQCQGVQKAVDEIFGCKNYAIWQTCWVWKKGE